MKFFGGVESGGTKFVCIVGLDPDHIISDTSFSTTNPTETIQRTIEFFRPYSERNELASLGIASFGPVDLDSNSETYGFITTTPKPGWQQVDLYGEIRKALNIPLAFDTDVNAAAYGEKYWISENKPFDPFLYITVGTGIGVGAIINGSTLHGLIHAETGHIAIPHNWEKDPFPGVCPFHGDCLEGLASGFSMSKRWGQKPETLPDSHSAWDLEAEYIALALVNLIYAYSPQRIVLGGGVSQHAGFYQSVREKVLELNNGYIKSNRLTEKIDEYIIPPGLGNRSGVLGAIAMAKNLSANM